MTIADWSTVDQSITLYQLHVQLIDLKRFPKVICLVHMIPFRSTPVLFNISQTNSPPSSTCNSKRNSLNFNATNLKPKSNSFSSSKDSEWLTLEICREYMRGECLRDEFSCRYAHPSSSIETQNGRVICCYDYLKVFRILRFFVDHLLVAAWVVVEVVLDDRANF